MKKSILMTMRLMRMMKKLENVDVDGTDVKVEVTPTNPFLDKKGQPYGFRHSADFAFPNDVGLLFLRFLYDVTV